MNVAYIRVSTAEQNEARQLEALKGYEIDKYYSEKVSAKNTNRPQLQAMLEFVREGDSVYVHDFSRLARSTKDLLSITDYLDEKKVNLISLKENIDTTTPTGKLMLTMIGAIAEFERQNILERQREGVALAKRRGAYKGRKKIEIPNFKIYYEKYMRRECNKAQIAKELGISRPTVDRLIQECKEASSNVCNKNE